MSWRIWNTSGVIIDWLLKHAPTHENGGVDALSLNGLSGTVLIPIVAKTGAYTATATDEVITCDATSAAFTITLPAVAGITGKPYTIKKTDSSGNIVTIDGNASETIDGATTYLLSSQYDTLPIVSDGSNWHIL